MSRVSSIPDSLGRNVPVMSMGDVPQPVRLRAVLHEVLELLRKEAAGAP
ncbi:hypothetical protein [Streptomyces europaeiscabiei]